MRWAQRLKRAFGIDVETCAACRGKMRIIACIEDQAVNKAILAHPTDKAHPVYHRGGYQVGCRRRRAEAFHSAPPDQAPLPCCLGLDPPAGDQLDRWLPEVAMRR